MRALCLLFFTWSVFQLPEQGLRSDSISWGNKIPFHEIVDCDAYGPIIFVSEIPSADIVQTQSDARPYDRVADNATTFVKGLIIFGVLAIMYALGKRFGLLDEDSDCRNKKRPRSGNQLD